MIVRKSIKEERIRPNEGEGFEKLKMSRLTPKLMGGEDYERNCL